MVREWARIGYAYAQLRRWIYKYVLAVAAYLDLFSIGIIAVRTPYFVSFLLKPWRPTSLWMESSCSSTDTAHAV